MILRFKARHEADVEPISDRFADMLAQHIIGFHRIVDDDNVRSAPSQHSADRGGQTITAERRFEVRYRAAGEAKRREGPAIPRSLDDSQAIAGMLVGEVLAVARANKPE